MSTIASHAPLNILETVREAWFQMANVESNGHVTIVIITSRDPERSNS